LINWKEKVRFDINEIHTFDDLLRQTKFPLKIVNYNRKMQKDLFQDIKQTIAEFQKSLSLHLPALEAEINHLIQSKNQDKNTIENTIDTLLSLTDMGVGKELFLKLLEYYKTIDAEGAAFYWNEYDKDDE